MSAKTALILDVMLAFALLAPERRKASATSAGPPGDLACCHVVHLQPERAKPSPPAVADGGAGGAVGENPGPRDTCAGPGVERSYNVSAIPITMTLNRFGDHDPQALMYVLDEKIGDVRLQEQQPLPDRVSTGLRKDAIQPLVIRANVGDCLTLRFTNRLRAGMASMHLHGIPHSVANAGDEVGLNPNTMAAPGVRSPHASSNDPL